MKNQSEKFDLKKSLVDKSLEAYILAFETINRIMHNLIVMAELETHQRTPQTDMLRELSGAYYRMSQNLMRMEG